MNETRVEAAVHARRENDGSEASAAAAASSSSRETRERFLRRVRSALPPSRERPEVPLFKVAEGEEGKTDGRSIKDRFASALSVMGGQSLSLPAGSTWSAWLAERFGADAVICSAVKEVGGTRPLDAATPPASLADVDVGVVRARFGVAETGSVWFSEAEYVVNAIGYLVQHLVVLLDETALIEGLQDAYRRPDFHSARYAVLVTGPSATADIEGVMIRGAQGVRSLTVVWTKAPG